MQVWLFTTTSNNKTDEFDWLIHTVWANKDMFPVIQCHCIECVLCVVQLQRLPQWWRPESHLSVLAHSGTPLCLCYSVWGTNVNTISILLHKLLNIVWDICSSLRSACGGDVQIYCCLVYTWQSHQSEECQARRQTEKTEKRTWVSIFMRQTYNFLLLCIHDVDLY